MDDITVICAFVSGSGVGGVGLHAGAGGGVAGGGLEPPPALRYAIHAIPLECINASITPAGLSSPLHVAARLAC